MAQVATVVKIARRERLGDCTLAIWKLVRRSPEWDATARGKLQSKCHHAEQMGISGRGQDAGSEIEQAWESQSMAILPKRVSLSTGSSVTRTAVD